MRVRKNEPDTTTFILFLLCKNILGNDDRKSTTTTTTTTSTLLSQVFISLIILLFYTKTTNERKQMQLISSYLSRNDPNLSLVFFPRYSSHEANNNGTKLFSISNRLFYVSQTKAIFIFLITKTFNRQTTIITNQFIEIIKQL